MEMISKWYGNGMRNEHGNDEINKWINLLKWNVIETVIHCKQYNIR